MLFSENYQPQGILKVLTAGFMGCAAEYFHFSLKFCAS